MCCSPGIEVVQSLEEDLLPAWHVIDCVLVRTAYCVLRTASAHDDRYLMHRQCVDVNTLLHNKHCLLLYD